MVGLSASGGKDYCGYEWGLGSQEEGNLMSGGIGADYAPKI